LRFSHPAVTRFFRRLSPQAQRIATRPLPGRTYRLPPRDYANDPIEFYRAGLREFGDLFRFQFGPVNLGLLTRPEHVRHVLHDKVENYPRGRLFSIFEIGVGQGIVSSEGPHWRKQRDACEPAFSPERTAAMVETVLRCCDHLTEVWRATAGAAVDVQSAMEGLVLEILSRLLIGLDLSEPGDPRAAAFKVLRDYINWRIRHVLSLPPSVPTLRNLGARAAGHQLDQFLFGLIRRRRSATSTGDDFLTMLARGPCGSWGMDDQAIRDNVLSAFFAAQESLVPHLTWTLHLLGQSPDVSAQLRAETRTASNDSMEGGGAWRSAPYASMVVSEVLRLYPAVWMFTREAVADDEINGYYIPAGSSVIISPFFTHRHPCVWPDPETFNPERFSEATAARRLPGSYLPFAAGPHECVGKEMARMILEVVSTTLNRRFRFHPLYTGPVPAVGMVAVYPRRRILMRVEALVEPLRSVQRCHSRDAGESYRLFNEGDIDGLLRRYVTPMPRGHAFTGRHALGGIRHGATAIRAWANRVFALFPDLHVGIKRIWVSGWPWRTHVAVEWADFATLATGERFTNEGVQIVELRWGRVVGTKWYVDTQHAAETMERLATQGLSEALAPPITDRPPSPIVVAPGAPAPDRLG
jgi:cytochrome P450/ketosteroid isomerase-like protein